MLRTIERNFALGTCKMLNVPCFSQCINNSFLVYWRVTGRTNRLHSLQNGLCAFFTNPVSSRTLHEWHLKHSGCQLKLIALITLPFMNNS
ncbi:hypothetical protein BpHYR1_044898 [Brachionus plicatilis]|uniref:Uncharacterized protein n=1 Tax=Brachionus plicatilis TaxID=10195 RepID=A0A3M7P2Z8_BRAPC|nr:hypothetical protein BpHYR1_044898 [Brachionus plicatilis]